eukprot:GHVU01180796.1.p1 GENE.GHVU01180796.1~~GHVU01180796.1.p1  ORF type:complete len:102 (+),score=5.08 GHVU01180796.1:351-656(+)
MYNRCYKEWRVSRQRLHSGAQPTRYITSTICIDDDFYLVHSFDEFTLQVKLTPLQSLPRAKQKGSERTPRYNKSGHHTCVDTQPRTHGNNQTSGHVKVDAA